MYKFAYIEVKTHSLYDGVKNHKWGKDKDVAYKGHVCMFIYLTKIYIIEIYLRKDPGYIKNSYK